MKPETPLPWKSLPLDPYITYGDGVFMLHACNAYPRIIETFLKAREGAALVGEPIGIVEGLFEDLLKELGEL